MNPNQNHKTRTTAPRRALKAGAASQYCGFSRRYLHDLTKQGRLPFHKVGPRCLVYDIADLDRFLDACKIGGAK